MSPMHTHLNTKFSGFEKMVNFFTVARAVGYVRHKISKPSAVAVSFEAAKNFYNAAKDADRSIKAGIKEFERLLGFGIDPVSLSWDKHRQLYDLNENAYSDWLAWTFEVVQVEVASLGALITKLFPPNREILNKVPQGIARIHRETPVERGHEGQTGRTDLILDFVEDSFVWHIEVKVSPAESADMAKNPGYFEALKKLFPKKTICNFILATAANKEIYHEGYGTFRAVTWSQLCQRLRQWTANRGRFGLAEYQCRMFCGMVEHLLLQIRSGSFNHLNYLKNTYKTE